VDAKGCQVRDRTVKPAMGRYEREGGLGRYSPAPVMALALAGATPKPFFILNSTEV
jgi:hypothetical protein